MPFPAVGNYSYASAAHSSINSGATTTPFSVNQGDSVYVFIGYGCGSGSIDVSSVSDTGGNTYVRAAKKQNATQGSYPAQEIWYADNVPTVGALTVTVAFSGHTFYYFSAVQVTGANGSGSLDAVSSGATGNTNPGSDPTLTLTPSDLVVACNCENRFSGTTTSASGFTQDTTGRSGPSGTVGGGSSDIYMDLWETSAAAPGVYNSDLSAATPQAFALITVAIKASVDWSGLSGKPYVTVSPIGIQNSGSGVPNNGADFGPDTLPSTNTSGVQEALNSIAATGGTVHCLRGKYTFNDPIGFTGSYQRLEFEPGSSITFTSGLTGIRPNWSSASHELPYCLVLMGSPAVSSNPAPFSHQAFVGNGVQINWNSTVTGFTIAFPGPQSSPMYSGAGGEDFLIEGVVSSGYIAECFGVHNQYQGYQPSYVQMSRHIIIRSFYDTRAAVSVGGSGFAVVGGVCDVLIEDVEIDLSLAYGGAGLSNCFIAGYQGTTSNVVVRRSRFISNGALPGQPLACQVLELQGNGLGSTTTGGCTDITIEDTVFDSGATSGSPVGGYGGAYLDDNNGTTGVGALNRIAFRNCQWVHCGMNFQSGGTASGYIVFEGNMPGEFQGSLGGRPLIQEPNLAASGSPASAIRTALGTSATQIAQYSVPPGQVSLYRVSVSVAAVSSDHATVTISWQDPDAGALTATPINGVSLSPNQVTNATYLVVANSTSPITVKGNAASSGTSLLGSATIEQVS
jgi:hypothetical protein